MNNAVTKIALLLIIICSSYVGFEANASSGKGEPAKIKVQMVNEPLKVVIPFPKAIER